MSKLNLELSNLLEWFRSNQLSLNIKKTNYIVFGRKRTGIHDSGVQLQLQIEGHVLLRVDNIKFLGVIIDSKLNW